MRTFVITCAAAALAVPLLVSGGGPAQADGPALLALTLDAGPLVVDGADQTALAHVSAQVSDPRGVGHCAPEPDAIGSGRVGVTLERTAGGAPATASLHLSLTGGTVADGTWEGDWWVGSTRSGTWTVTRVGWCFVGGGSPGDYSVDVDPRLDPGVTRTVTIAGTDAPTVTVTRVPHVVPYGGRQWNVFTYRDGHGRPLVGRPIHLGREVNCGLYGVGGTWLRTDARGRTPALRASAGFLHDCVFLTSPPGVNVKEEFENTALLLWSWVTRYERYARVSAQWSGARVSTGQFSGKVSGRVSPAAGRVWLQYKVKRGWVDAWSQRVRPSGRYDFGLWFSPGVTAVRVLARASAPFSQHRYLAPTSSPTYVVPWR